MSLRKAFRSEIGSGLAAWISPWKSWSVSLNRSWSRGVTGNSSSDLNPGNAACGFWFEHQVSFLPRWDFGWSTRLNGHLHGQMRRRSSESPGCLHHRRTEGPLPLCISGGWRAKNASRRGLCYALTQSRSHIVSWARRWELPQPLRGSRSRLGWSRSQRVAPPNH